MSRKMYNEDNKRSFGYPQNRKLLNGGHPERGALSTDIIRTSFSPPPPRRSLHLWTFLRVCWTSKTFTRIKG